MNPMKTTFVVQIRDIFRCKYYLMFNVFFGEVHEINFAALNGFRFEAFLYRRHVIC